MSANRWSAVAVLCLAALPAQAATGGMSDTFENGTTNGWSTGSASPSPPINVAGGGPGGVADHYMLATSNGVGGAGSRLVVFNTSQWAGDYLAAGITAVTMDVRNFGNTALELHLALNNTAVTLGGVALPAGSGWTHVAFSLLPSALSAGASAILPNVTELRLYHGTTSPVIIAAQLGVDNITAVASPVPEPGGAALASAGLMSLWWIGARRRKARGRGP